MDCTFKIQDKGDEKSTETKSNNRQSVNHELQMFMSQSVQLFFKEIFV